MLDKCPSEKEIISLVGKPLYNIWLSLTESIDAKYEMERLWNSGGKMWKYEYKYRRGGKTLCALMQEKTVSGLWSSSVKTKGQNLKKNEIATQRKRKPFTTKRRHSTTANG